MRPVEIDGIIFSLQRYGGISVYFRELMKYLSRRNVPYTTSLFEPIVQNLDDIANWKNLTIHKARLLERVRSAPSHENSAVFHSTYYRNPANSSLPSVVTVHDFINEKKMRGVKGHLHTLQKKLAVERAQIIICISNTTKNDLIKQYKIRKDQRIEVIYNGVSENYKSLTKPCEYGDYILYVGQRGGYKNFKLVLESLKYLPGFKLICVGGSDTIEADNIVLDDELKKRIMLLGHVSEERLNVLYDQAVCLAFPSRYEGFGIPVAEAMRAGCPVVSIDCEAVLEIGREAITRSQDCPRSFAESVISTLNQEYRAQCVRDGLLISEQYDWEKCHMQTLQVYDSLR